MNNQWTCRDWQPGGRRRQLGDLVFDSTIHCGAGNDFQAVGPAHYRCRSRCGNEPYAWRLNLRIESPGDSRSIILEVADFNHEGQELWQEGAAVISTDGNHWQDLGTEHIEVVPWTPTGVPAADNAYGDAHHRPYGVRFHLRLSTKTLYLATPTPYTLQHSQAHLESLVARCSFFSLAELVRSPGYAHHGHPLHLLRACRPGPDSDRLRVVVMAGEHAGESAGMVACDGFLEEILRCNDLLNDISFWVIPVVNVDGVALGRTYHAPDPNDPLGPGINLSRDWDACSRPEVQAIHTLLEQVKPHLLLSLHNGRHRRQCEVLSLPHPQLASLLRHLRHSLPLPLEGWRPAQDPGMSVVQAPQRQLADLALCVETLLLCKAPHCQTFWESYRQVGIGILRGVVAGLRECHGRPGFRSFPEVVDTRPLRLQIPDFTCRLPAFYYSTDFSDAGPHAYRNVEANGLPLPPGVYDVHLHLAADVETLTLMRPDKAAQTRRGNAEWICLPSVPIPAHKLRFDYQAPGTEAALTSAIICPEGMPLDNARKQARDAALYRRNTRLHERTHLQHWGAFHERLTHTDFGLDNLITMRDDLLQWTARRQVCEPQHAHWGAIHSEEDKFDARDAAAATVLFAQAFRDTGNTDWLERALLARRYVYRNQVREPGNPARHGGFVHMVSGTWGVQFTRLETPYPGIDGVDTCAIIHLLCQAADLGLPLEEEDQATLQRAAQWVANNEAKPGVFLHHEGALRDCQNMNALGLSALARAAAAVPHLDAPRRSAWLAAARRGLSHYLDGQEAIGVWPYFFAQVGRRGQAFSSDNIPDHGMGLYHLTRALDSDPLATHPGLAEALQRAACWYLCMAHWQGTTIDLDYDRRPNLGDDICFSGFTWCRFTAAATLLRIARYSPDSAPWMHLALALMEHVQNQRWQKQDPTHAPVIAHARPDAKLATWCQAAEWDAVMLNDMIHDLKAIVNVC